MPSPTNPILNLKMEGVDIDINFCELPVKSIDGSIDFQSDGILWKLDEASQRYFLEMNRMLFNFDASVSVSFELIK